ncbi:MAG TPA: prolyl oligopeptidase family serine peptidase, partial [bacterium]|nr:prolyl oligopeptidase family serine peptidase [bacterium]
YGQAFMDMDNYKLRMNSVRDGKAMTDQLVKEGISIPGEFIATGGSYGGFMVVASMAKFPEDYSCGIDTVGVVDFVDFLENTKSYRRKLREVEYGPLSDKEFLKSISPTNMVDTIRGELFVAHGMNDPRVPVSDAYILLDKLKKAGKKTKKLIFEDEGHGFRKKENRLVYNKQSAEFIEGCK